MFWEKFDIKMESLSACEIDSVELNSLRADFNVDTLIDYYAESFVDLGYITLFCAVFPLGPALALLSIIGEI